MKIKIPTRLSKLKIEHLKAYDIISKEDKTINDKVEVISIITGVSVNVLRGATLESINLAFSKCLELFNQFNNKAIPLSINIEGKEYELVQNYAKLPASWFIDLSHFDFSKQPEYLVAFNYIEKGMGYAQMDKNKNILNPLKERADVFKRTIDLEFYLSLTAFFLKKYQQYRISYDMIQATKERLKNKKLGNGKV